MKRFMGLILVMIMMVSVCTMPVSAAGNGYRWQRAAGEAANCGIGCPEGCRCGKGPFDICDNRNADAATDTAVWGFGWCLRADPDAEFGGKIFVDADGDGLCDRCGQSASVNNSSEEQTGNENRGVCDGTGPKGKGRGRRNR